MLSNHSIKFQTFHVSYIVKTRHPCFSYIPVYIYIYYEENNNDTGEGKTSSNSRPLSDRSRFFSFLELTVTRTAPTRGTVVTSFDTPRPSYLHTPTHSNRHRRRFVVSIPRTFSFWPTSSRARSCLPDLASPIREPTERDLEGMKSGYLSWWNERCNKITDDVFYS